LQELLDMSVSGEHSLGIDNDTLSKILGHADFDITSDIYIQADINKLHQEMAKLDPCED